MDHGTPAAEGALWTFAVPYLWTVVVNAANLLGVARGAVEEFRELAGRQASTSSATLLRDRPRVRDRR